MADNVALFGPAGGRVLKEDSTVLNQADKLEEQMGGKGFHVIADTAAHLPGTGRVYGAIMILTTTALTQLLAHSTAPITGTITGVSLSAGTWIYGKFTSITLASGSVIAYLGTA